MTLFLLAVSTALLVSALCSLLEATLLSLTSAQVARMASHPRALWQEFKANVERPIAVILVLNTTAHTIGATVAGAEFERLWGERWLFAFSLALSYVMLQFTEILPKTIGVAHRERVAPIVAGPLDLMVRGLEPVLRLVHFVNRPFATRRGRGSEGAADEIAALAGVARTAGAIDARQARIIQAASRLPKTKVSEVMTPRTEVVFVRVDQPLDEVLAIVRDAPFTRLPLCERDLDDVIGMLHVRDLFNELRRSGGGRNGPDGPLDLRSVRRHVLEVPERLSVAELLRRFQESRIHLAVVVDEYGSGIGVVTLEDILEEMVGEIEDEFDRPRSGPALVEAGDGTWRAAGSVGLNELRDRLGLAVDDDDTDTLGGAILKRLGRLPSVGDAVTLGSSWEARVLSVERHRVGLVELRTAVPPPGAPGRAPTS